MNGRQSPPEPQDADRTVHQTSRCGHCSLRQRRNLIQRYTQVIVLDAYSQSATETFNINLQTAHTTAETSIARTQETTGVVPRKPSFQRNLTVV